MKNVLTIMNSKEGFRHPKTICLDEKTEWIFGSNTEESIPDIELPDCFPEIQGKFVYEDKYWFYINKHFNKNVFHNGKMIKTGAQEVDPIFIELGDEIKFIYNGGEIRCVYQRKY